MCRDALHPFLAALPKCEHHIHIEGSLTPELLFQLAAKNHVTLPAAADAAFASPETLRARYERFSSLDDFLGYYYIGCSVLVTASDFEALAYAYLARAHADRVRHAELSFDPQAHAARGVAYATVVAGLTAARRRAEADFPGLSTALVLCVLRHLPPAEALATLEAAVAAGHFADGTVAGVGLDSSETGFPPALFAAVYARARELGLRRTAHACEEGPPEWMGEALDALGIQRADHGVRAAEDGAVLARLARERVLLTMCPVSNVQLRCFDSVAAVPVRRLLDAGVRFSINSDDPAYFGAFVGECYCAVQEAHRLSVEEWARIASAAVDGSWCGAERKAALLAEVDGVVGEWREKLGAGV